MNPQATGQVELVNDTVINVAALLRELTGATRDYRFRLDRFQLDADLAAVGVDGRVRLTRLSDAILVSVNAAAALIALDPYDEAAILALADGLSRSGRRVAARDLIVDYARRLQAELDEPISPELALAAKEFGATSVSSTN